MLPTLASRPLEVVNAEHRGGRYLLRLQDVAMVRVLALTSGTPVPYLRLSVDWGDSSSDHSDDVPIGRELAFAHPYRRPGEYFIQIAATNSAGERSALTPDHTAALRVSLAQERQRSFARWSGLGLPARRLGTSVAATQELYPVIAVKLATPAAAGTYSISTLGGGHFLSGAAVTIFEPGRVITSARIVSTTSTAIELDTPTADDYSVEANVEIRQRSIGASHGLIELPDPDWGFPASRDEDLVRSSLVCLFGTRPLERLMRPAVGWRGQELVHEPNDVVTQQLGVAYAADTLALEPRVTADEIRYEHDETDPHASKIVLRCSFRGSDSEVFEAAVPLSLIAGEQTPY